ncbi:MAG TPA: aquaporin [Terriglobales bacterium]|nr:aquaporin [Terriglobales bacterium]
MSSTHEREMLMHILQQPDFTFASRARRFAWTDPARTALLTHWPEYLMESAELAVFMLAACFFTVLLQHPASPLRMAIADPMLRRVLTGAAMGATAIALIYSPWGQRSGGHLNPAVTLTFARLKKVAPWDAFFYVLAQFSGGVLGVLLASFALGASVSDHAVRFATTVPGPQGSGVAFIAEAIISFGLMTMVLNVTNSSLARYTGLFAGLLVMTYISFEAPLSGMSMNPARSFASALPLRLWDALWVYFTAPPIGMLAAGELYAGLRGARSVICAKLHHQNDRRCIFHCGYREQGQY